MKPGVLCGVLVGVSRGGTLYEKCMYTVSIKYIILSGLIITTTRDNVQGLAALGKVGLGMGGRLLHAEFSRYPQLKIFVIFYR